MTLEEKQKALELRKQGKGYGEIAKNIGVSKSSITTFLKRDYLSETCPICGKKIIQKNGHRKRKFCSDKCRIESWKISKDNKFGNIEKTCRYCGCHFLSYVSKDTKYCSRKCYLNDIRKEVSENEQSFKNE